MCVSRVNNRRLFASKGDRRANVQSYRIVLHESTRLHFVFYDFIVIRRDTSDPKQRLAPQLNHRRTMKNGIHESAIS